MSKNMDSMSEEKPLNISIVLFPLFDTPQKNG